MKISEGTKTGVETMAESILRGIGVSPGIAIGPAFVIDQHGVPVPEYTLSAVRIGEEIKRFQTAIVKTQKQLGQLKQKASSLPAGATEEIALLLEAYLAMLSGSRLVRGVEERITNERINAEAAIQRQINAIAASFAAMGDAYLKARIVDVREVGSRLIRNLLQQQYNPFADAPEGSVLIAEEITPADTALMNPERIAGFAAVLGGAEGHCHVGIVATGVRDAQGQGGVGPVGDFLNGQRIHVGAIGQGGTRMGTLEDAHHTVPAHVLLDLQAELAQP